MTTLPQNQEKCLRLCFGFTDTAEHYQFFYSDPLSCFSLFSISSSIDIICSCFCLAVLLIPLDLAINVNRPVDL